MLQVEKKQTLASVVRDMNSKSHNNQYTKTETYNWSLRIFNMYKAGLTTKEISDITNIKASRIGAAIEGFRPLFKVEQVSFGRKNEPYTEDSLMGILPKYNSYELKGEEAEMFFLEDSPYKFKLEYEKE